MIQPIIAGVTGLSAAYTVGGHALAQARALKRRADLPDCVALTFDDGPHPDTTPAILQCLADHGVPATFFMVGRHAEANPALARQVADLGHDLANHTHSHRHLWTVGPSRTTEELVRATAAIGDAAGRAPVAFRPPWGVFNAASMPAARRLNQPCVLWSVRSEGLVWRPSPEEMTEHVVGRVSGGDIINLHDAGGFPDTPTRVLSALPAIIGRLREAGFRFVLLREML
jgi:peptidoglycan/xylan/chitin deacetylase (PgdA/CDA1 family)